VKEFQNLHNQVRYYFS